MTEKQIVTLLVEEGKKPGQPIATYLSGRRRYLVFMPENTPVGKQVRVELVDTGKKDSRGEPLYRGVPSPVEYTERWKDNGDETASRVKIAKDWKLEESEVEVLETRKLETKDGNPTSRWDWEVRWGNDLTSTQLIRQTVQEVPTLQEIVCSDGTLSWKQTCSRQEAEPEKQLEILGALKASGWFTDRYCELTWNPTWSVSIVFEYRDSIGKEDAYIEQTKWGELPSWLQAEVQSRYPICSCGRQRRDTQVEDGYAKCELCRTKETCVRCGKKTTVKNLSGRLVCADCEPYESAEQLIETLLPRERREAIAGEAKKRRSGQALRQAEGEAVLKATIDHIPDSWTRERLVQKWFGYGWYYFCVDGVYGTKLAPAALAILEHLPQATGNGLVEMIAWLTLGPKPGSKPDYYIRTQVASVIVSLPPLEETLQKLAEGSLGLADRLRGSEADRLEAVESYRLVAEKLGKDDPLVKAIEEVLQAETQDYSAALIKIAEAKTVISSREAVETAIAKYFSNCPICGQPLDGGCRKGSTHWPEGIYPSDMVQWDEWPGGDIKDTALAQIVTDAGNVVAKLILIAESYRHGSDFGDVIIHRPQPDEGGAWDGKTPFRELTFKDLGRLTLDPHQRQLAKLYQQLVDLQQEVEGSEMARDHEAEEYSQVELTAAERATAEPGSQEVTEGDIIEATFHEEERQGQPQMVAGPLWDDPSGTWIKLVVDPFQGLQVATGETRLVKVRAKNSQQVELFTYRVENPEGQNGRGGRKVLINGYFAIPIRKPSDSDADIAETKTKIADLEVEISRLEADIKANPPKPKARPQAVVTESSPQGKDDFGDGAMAEAMRRAGLLNKEEKPW